MNRAERRAKTNAVMKRRLAEARQVGRWTPRIPGQARVKHPFDCGHAGCWVCHKDRKQVRKDAARKEPLPEEDL